MIKYYNLGQIVGHRVVYLRSTDIECKNYKRLLWSVPDEWLYFLYLDKNIMIIDKSSNKGKVEHIFIPALNDCLNFIYFNQTLKYSNLKFHTDNLINEILKTESGLLKKYLFWKGKIKKQINILAETIHVKKEPNILLKLIKEK